MHAAYRRALKAAGHSRHKKQKMAAVIWRSGRVLAVSCNGRQFGRHAELRAIAKDVNCKNALIAVARSNRGNSKPCIQCLNLIKAVGIRWVVFHNGRRVVRQRPEWISPDKDYKENQ